MDDLRRERRTGLELILEWIDREHGSQVAAAAVLGVTPQALSRFLLGDGSMEAGAMYRLRRATKLPWECLVFRDARVCDVVIGRIPEAKAA